MCLALPWIGGIRGCVSEPGTWDLFRGFPKISFQAKIKRQTPTNLWEVLEPVGELVDTEAFVYMVVDVGVPWIGGIRGGDSTPGTWELYAKKLNISFRSGPADHLLLAYNWCYRIDRPMVLL